MGFIGLCPKCGQELSETELEGIDGVNFTIWYCPDDEPNMEFVQDRLG